MRIRTAVASTIVGVAMVFTLAAPAAAQGGRSNLMVASGASFLPASPATAVQPVLNTLTPRMTFETSTASAAAFASKASSDPHKIGIGLRSGGFAFGIGFVIRYWVSDLLFIDGGLSHYGYGFGGVTVISGSVQYVFKEIDNPTLHARIYGGGGINFTNYSFDTGFGVGADSSSIGFQGLAGVELIFSKFPKLGVGGDLGFYSSHDVLGFGSSVGGFGSSVYAVWYIK